MSTSARAPSARESRARVAQFNLANFSSAALLVRGGACDFLVRPGVAMGYTLRPDPNSSEDYETGIRFDLPEAA
jgi:hypothetical protein